MSKVRSLFFSLGVIQKRLVIGQSQAFGSKARNMSTMDYTFETLKVTRPKDFVVQVEMNRPKKLNAMNRAFWRECRECFQRLSTDEDCRVVLVSGSGKAFTAGLDLTDMAEDFMSSDLEVGRKAFKLRNLIRDYQETFTVIEKCPKPVIAAIHNACVGGGVDMTSACDIRYCTSDAWFQIKEVDVGLTADVGTLQRFPKIVGNDSLVRELCYTARKFYSDEAKQIGYVSRIFPDKEAMIEGSLEMASMIASKSPIAVQGTKVSLVFSRDHGVQEGLNHVGLWNQGMLQSEDVMKSAMAAIEKKQATFSKL
ncbi:delta(3,5)-Delta(2,4)-dienoyl-CoA isomerase, mitochondrial-like [Saccostrea echinata]|uniref:delta(3,5)-Delta(2,4)-dienoyl-CoA isomerase, mitochondrial-like n=1 Tax=Saccostrea echinata TaxID=191078 RepID=UPI002A7FE406|nr:delta(3,5)-Delta(2,4)-dienoyl-CoA isomerase, mitochondrial-like [Saccostrea echinata]